jgi:hypothetical protein
MGLPRFRRRWSKHRRLLCAPAYPATFLGRTPQAGSETELVVEDEEAEDWDAETLAQALNKIEEEEAGS